MLTGLVVFVSVIIPWTLLILIPLVMAYVYLRRRYLKSSREMKRLEAIGKLSCSGTCICSVNRLSLVVFSSMEVVLR